MAEQSEVKNRIQNDFNSLMKFRTNRRKQEEIISDVTKILGKVKKETFIPFLLQMLNSIQFRDTSEAFKNLKSPFKQLVYLIDLFFSTESTEIENSPNDEEWNRLTELLDEVEMTYFGEIGFFNEETEDFQLDKISVTLKAFFDYYSNGQLCFEEQNLNRLTTNFSKFDDEIYQEFSFRTDDVVEFYKSLNILLQDKADRCFYFHQHTEEWSELTSKFIERGLNDPHDWASQPELSDMIGFMSRPGYIFILTQQELSLLPLEKETVSKIIAFLKYDERVSKGKIIYYSDESPYLKTPIIELNEKELLIPNGKYVLEAFYNRLNLFLIGKKKEKYSQYKNKMLEKNTLEVFKSFFPPEALFFTSFYFDKATRSEQDLAIYYNKTLFIIEIKDFKFRAPMRNPISGFDKIRSDFKGGIQKAYEQCKRLEDQLVLSDSFKIYDLKTSKELFEIRPKKIKNYYSIIVTQHRYGGIQTNLHELLEKNQDDLYPWSICIDDLEIFLTCLKKIKNTSRVKNFINYLDYREAYHERLVCSDELELCGFFLNTPATFEKFATQDEILATDVRMSDIFQAHYESGLGLPNEFNLEAKRKNKLREYAKNFDITIVSGSDLTT